MTKLLLQQMDGTRFPQRETNVRRTTKYVDYTVSGDWNSRAENASRAARTSLPKHIQNYQRHMLGTHAHTHQNNEAHNKANTMHAHMHQNNEAHNKANTMNHITHLDLYFQPTPNRHQAPTEKTAKSCSSMRKNAVQSA